MMRQTFKHLWNYQARKKIVREGNQDGIKQSNNSDMILNPKRI